MLVKVIVAPKVEREITCARFRVVDGNLLFYSDVRMGQLLCGFKKWIRFYVKENVMPESTVQNTKDKLPKKEK